MSYQSEAQLVDEFVAELRLAMPWGITGLAREFNYGRGRTDLVGIFEGGRVIAVEAKLQRWKQALQQAYRNTCFAHQSYVLLPWGTAQRAAQFDAEFRIRGIGLCTIRNDEIEVLIEPDEGTPLQPRLTATAASHCQA